KSAQRNCHLLLADLDLDLGDVPGAAEAFKQATLDVPETDFSSGAHIVGAELALHQNDLDGARFHAEEGLAVATNADDRLSFSRALMTRAAIRINAGSIDDVKRGLDDLDDALRIAEETDYKLLRWHATQLRTKGLRKLAILDPPNASSHLLRAQNCDLGSAVALRLSDEQIAAAREAADAWLGHPPETADRFRL
ncbi:MAG TPA: hypothetical protein VD863_28090, partial [Bradyrhizobium sp.]|nr:hypothetical protein [Bradyrhizobium sp.]